MWNSILTNFIFDEWVEWKYKSFGRKSAAEVEMFHELIGCLEAVQTTFAEESEEKESKYELTYAK
jgi:hypothetical protein